MLAAPADTSGALGEWGEMSLENRMGDPRGAGFFWGLLISLAAVAAMLWIATKLYFDLNS